MDHYVQLDENGGHLGTWLVDGDRALRVDVTNPEGGANTYFRAVPGDSIWETLKRSVPPWFTPHNTFHKTERGPGDYFFRIARPFDNDGRSKYGAHPANERFRDEIAVGQGQLTAVVRQLERICQTVYPCPDTFDTFGHDIRNLLIVGCTEVEAHWRNVLLANGYPDRNHNRKDYVKLVGPLRLREYGIAFPYYPWIKEPIRPFENWGLPPKPIRGLWWYDAYNSVKHDRERNFKDGTLLSLFHAVAACAAMMCAQFGNPEEFGWPSELRYFLEIAETPRWDPSELYLRPHGAPCIGREYPFPP